MVRRFYNWEERLAEAFSSCENAPFSYGAHDCCLFTADMIKVITGKDIAEGLRGYDTLRKARYRIKKRGGFEAMLDGIFSGLGCPEINPRQATAGDAIYVKSEIEEALGIVDLNGLYFLIADDVGMKAFPLRESADRRFIKKAWRIG